MGRPVIFAVLTTMVAFSPLLLAGGTMGNFMRNIPIVVIAVLFGSLVNPCLSFMPIWPGAGQPCLFSRPTKRKNHGVDHDLDYSKTLCTAD
ncbi:MAG: hypothetical protein R2861_12935 [Desulfobacterales bacterium]